MKSIYQFHHNQVHLNRVKFDSDQGMGLGRIFSGGPTVEFLTDGQKVFFPGGTSSGEVSFCQHETRTIIFTINLIGKYKI